GAFARHRFADIPERQVETVSQPRLDPLARAQPVHAVWRPGAGLEEALRPALAEPEAQRLEVPDQALVATRLGADEQVRERRARQQLLLARLERPEAREQ